MTTISRRSLVPDLSRWGAVCACLIGSLVSGWMAWNRIFSPDEYEAVHQGWLLASGQRIYHDFNSNHPPIYFLLLSLIPRLFTDGVDCLRTARIASWCLFLVDACLIYRLTVIVTDRRAARWAASLFLLSATMWEWAIEVRTDTVLVPLWLCALWLLLEPRPLHWLVRYGGVGLLMAIAFWTNQKAALHGMPLAAWVALGVVRREVRWKQLLTLVGSFLAFNGLVVGMMFYWGLWHDLRENLFTGGADLVKARPYAVFRWTTLRQVVLYDAGLNILCAVSCLGLLQRWKTLSDQQRLVLIGSLWMFATFWMTPGPFGYYFLSILPFALIATGTWLSWRMSEGLFRQVNVWGVLAVVLVYLAPNYAWLEEVVPHTNRRQAQAIRLGQQLVGPETRVFDFSGSLITRPNAYPFHTRLSPAEVHRFRHKLPPLVDTLRRDRVPLLIASDRFSFPAFDQGQAELKRQFVSLWGPLRVPGYDSQTLVGPESRSIEIWYDGTYECDVTGLEIDGMPFRSPMHLSAGLHTISLRDAPPARVVLRDASYREHISLPDDQPPLREFLYLHWIYERMARGR